MEKSKVKFVVVADCRCGGTALVRTLNKHPELVVLGELMSADQPYFEIPPDFDKFYSDTFQHCNGWHLHRFQLPAAYAWYKLSKYPKLKVIDLRRENLKEQYASFKMAQETSLWHERPDEIPRIEWDTKDYKRQTTEWINGRIWTDHVFSFNPVLRITFEQIVENFNDVLGRCQDFLGVERAELNPAMKRMEAVDYSKVFVGWPG